MTNTMITDFDAVTGESVTRAATIEEIQNFEILKQAKESEELLESEKAAAKAAVLAKLGITEDELKAALA